MNPTTNDLAQNYAARPTFVESDTSIVFNGFTRSLGRLVTDSSI